MRTAGRALDELARLRPDPGAALVAGAHTGAVPYAEWDLRGGSRRGRECYLAYSTVRYLGLCLQESPPAGR